MTLSYPFLIPPTGYKNSKLCHFENLKRREVSGLKSPFSFFGTIFIDSSRYNREELQEILCHERTHVNEMHSLDVIFSEISCLVCWFNPFVWLMKKEVRMNLEYLADKSVIESVKDTQHYQLHLLRLSHHQAIAQLSNNFNVSPLKKRIQMMNKKKSSNAGILKYVLLMPLLAGLLFINNLQARDNKKVIVEAPLIAQAPPPITTTENKGQKADDTTQSNPDKSTNDNIFTHVEQMPQYPGGDKEMMNFLSKNIKYPVDAQKQKIQGSVVCRFVIDKSGKVTDVTVLRSLSPSTDTEAIKVIKSMPEWIPGKQGGEPVSVYYTLPIRFKLGNNDSDKNKSVPTLDEMSILLEGKQISKEDMEKIPADTIQSMDVNKDKKTIIITLKK